MHPISKRMLQDAALRRPPPLQGMPAYIINVFRETSLVGLTSLLTSVLLHAASGSDPNDVVSPHTSCQFCPASRGSTLQTIAILCVMFTG